MTFGPCDEERMVEESTKHSWTLGLGVGLFMLCLESKILFVSLLAIDWYL